MQQKSYQNKTGAIIVVAAVVSTLVLAAMKVGGLLTLTWLAVFAPIVVAMVAATLALIATVVFLTWFAKHISK